MIAAVVLIATPLSIAIKANSSNSNPASENEGLFSVQGVVTAFLYDEDENETQAQDDSDDDMNDSDEDEIEDAIIASLNGHKTGERTAHVTAFVIDNKTVVEFGPWWYWAETTPNVTGVVHIGDLVNVTGETDGDEDGAVLDAFKIVDMTTGQTLTIKEEGRPPWAGSPKALDY